MKNAAAMIVYNGFLHKDAPPQCVTRFFEAAKIRGIDLVPVKNAELTEVLFLSSETNGEKNRIRDEINDEINNERNVIPNEISGKKQEIFDEINGEKRPKPSAADKNSKRSERIDALLSSCSFVIFWDKDTVLCRVLEDRGLRVFNSSEAIRVCDDKALTALSLSEKKEALNGAAFSHSNKTENLKNASLSISEKNETSDGGAALSRSNKTENLKNASLSISEKKEIFGGSIPLNRAIKMPKTLIAPMTFQNIGYTDISFIDSAAALLGFPMVVKERNGSLGEQVYLAKNYAELKNLVQKNGFNLLFQEFIDTSRSARFFDCPDAFADERGILKDAERLSKADCPTDFTKEYTTDLENIKRLSKADCPDAFADERGTDLKHTENSSFDNRLSKTENSPFDIRIYVLNGRTLGAILRKNPSDFRANIAKGSTAFPYNPTDAERQIAETAAAKTGLFFGGADIIADKNGERYLLEVNSNAGFAGFEKATGIDAAQSIIDEIIKNL